MTEEAEMKALGCSERLRLISHLFQKENVPKIVSQWQIKKQRRVEDNLMKTKSRYFSVMLTYQHLKI